MQNAPERNPTAADAPERGQAASAMKQLSNWAAASGPGEIPPETLRRSAIVTADMIAAVLAMREDRAVAAAQAALAAASPRTEATIFGTGRLRTDRIGAAVANGLAGNGAQLDPGYRGMACHPALYITPALVAEAEATDMTLGRVLQITAVAFDVTIRIARAFPPPPAMLYPAAIYGAAGAAAAIGLARCLSGEALCSALAAAATMTAPGPFGHAVRGEAVCDVWAGAAAWNGFRAVEWSGYGFSAAADTPLDVYRDVYGCGLDLAQLTAGLGEEWSIELSFHKLHAACQYTHSGIEAALALRPRLLDAVSDIAGAVGDIRVETGPKGLIVDNRAPTNPHGAKYSMQHAVAATLILGHGGPAAFDAASLAEPSIAALRERVRLAPYPDLPAPPNDRPARIRVSLADGRVLEEECASARGGADRPLGEAEILAKLDMIAGSQWPRLAPCFAEIIEDPARFSMQPWRAIVERMLAQ